MDRKKILAALSQKKLQNPTFTIIFFLIFSFFVYFAIRPNLVTAFSLQKELQEVKLKNREYEEQILQIVNYQTAVEEYRDDFVLLDQAIPPSPSIVKVVNDIRKSASDSGILLTSLQVTDSFEFKKETGKSDKLVSFSIATTYEIPLQQLEQFISSLTSSRRITTIESIEISNIQSDAPGTVFNITMNIKGYFL